MLRSFGEELPNHASPNHLYRASTSSNRPQPPRRQPALATATTEVHLILETQKGKAVTVLPKESLANNDKIISIDGENNELHGDWLLVTRKKKIPKNPISISSKTFTPKVNRFNALNNLTHKNKAGPPNHNTQPHPYPYEQSRAPQIPKETKRRRHDDVTNNEPAFDYSHVHTLMLSAPNHKTPAKPAYVAKNIPKLPNSQNTTSDPQKHVPLESNIPTPDPNYSSSIMLITPSKQTEHETNNSNKA